MKAQEVYAATYGDMHPLVAGVKCNKALIYMKQGKRDVAKQLFLECKAISHQIGLLVRRRVRAVDPHQPC